MYLSVLDDFVEPNRRLTHVIKKDEFYLEDNLAFQRDGAPLRYVLSFRQYLDITFSGR